MYWQERLDNTNKDEEVEKNILEDISKFCVGLYGLDPGSEELFSQTNPVATSPFGNSQQSTN